MSHICYFPYGGVPDSSSPPMIPCDPSAQTTACCAPGDSCFDNGLCLSQQFFFYRGGCTEKSFPSASCATRCTGLASDQLAMKSSKLIEPSMYNVNWREPGRWPYIAAVQNTFQVVLPCGNIYSAGPHQTFTCSKNETDCLIANFTMPLSSPTATSITGNVVVDASSSNTSTTSTVTVTASASISACPTKQAESTGISAATLGVAIAVPVVVLSILALSGLFFYWREHKKRVNAEKAQPYPNTQAYSNAQAYPNAHSQDPKPPVEIGANGVRTYELAGADGQGPIRL